MTQPSKAPESEAHKAASDVPFYAALFVLSGFYIFMIAAMLFADATYISFGHFQEAISSPEIQYSIKLSMISCSLTALLSLWIAVPLGYLMSRYSFKGKNLLDAVLDIPIVLPPLVIGLSLLILFRTGLGQQVQEAWEWLGMTLLDRETSITFHVPAVILAQFMVACAFAVRTLRATFDQINPRQEQVALTLGCSRSQAFWNVVFPQAGRGVLTAGTLAWARSLGEFGPILVFAGATRMRTEVLPTSVFLELSVGNIEGAVAVSLLMVIAAILVLVIVRLFAGGSLYIREL